VPLDCFGTRWRPSDHALRPLSSPSQPWALQQHRTQEIHHARLIIPKSAIASLSFASPHLQAPDDDRFPMIFLDSGN
jgi:hypothetical protein